MRDLTVNDDHTYYVLAGNEPVLVHNCGGRDSATGKLDDDTYDAIEAKHNTRVAEGVDYQVQRMHDGTSSSADHEIPGIGHDPEGLGDYFAGWQGKGTHRDIKTGATVALDPKKNVLIVENSYMIHGYKFSAEKMANSLHEGSKGTCQLRTSVRLTVRDGSWVVRFTPTQADVVRGSLVVLAELEISRLRRAIQFGFGVTEIEELVRRLDHAGVGGAGMAFTADEMRMVYLSLWQVPEMFGSEESFYVRLGFFSEHARSLARELLAATDREV